MKNHLGRDSSTVVPRNAKSTQPVPRVSNAPLTEWTASYPPRNGSDNQKWLNARNYCVRQRRVHRIVRQIFTTRKKSQKWSSLLRNMFANRPAQHRESRPQCVQHRTPRHGTLHFKLHFAVKRRECPQMRGHHHSNHANVCTSTESTAGRSRTIGFQLSPASADAYTWPPVVPKYTPQESSVATAIA